MFVIRTVIKIDASWEKLTRPYTYVYGLEKAPRGTKTTNKKSGRVMDRGRMYLYTV